MAFKLTEGNEQFSACVHLAQLIQGVDSDIAAYAIERFMVEYERNDETPLMALVMANNTLRSMTGYKDEN